MGASALAQAILPPEESLDSLVAAIDSLKPAPTTSLTGPSGEHLVLPPAVFEVLRQVVGAMAAGHAVTVVPVHQRLTTQEAADLLDISRPTLVKILDSGEIPFERPGRHRRVRLVDVLNYRDRRSVQRRKSLDRMVEIGHESGMYEKTAKPRRTR